MFLEKPVLQLVCKTHRQGKKTSLTEAYNEVTNLKLGAPLP